MIRESFLICALSLPLANAPRPMLAESNPLAEEIKQLRDFIQKHVPDSEITITPPRQEMPGWERFPLTWRDMWIWIRRPEVHQRKERRSA